jgi:hypothetical protein
MAGRKKEEGNLLFKSGKYQRASKKYDKVNHLFAVTLIFQVPYFLSS